MKPLNHLELGFLITDLSGGGAERVLTTLATKLGNQAPQLFLFEDQQVYPFTGQVQILDIPLRREMSRKRRVFEMLRGVRRLREAKKTRGIQICISFLTWPNIYNILTRNDEQVIISVRNNLSLSLRGFAAPVIKGLVRTLYPRADQIVAISEDVRRDLIENFKIPPRQVTTIHNPVDLQHVQRQMRAPLPAPLRDLPRYPTIVTAGRFSCQKGQWHLLRAFQQVKQVIPTSRLLLLGEGPDKDYLVNLSRSLGFRTWVHDEPGAQPTALAYDVLFPGFIANPFVILANATLFAFPSLWEGMGNVLLESMACGLPVIAADCRSGPREILAPKTPLTRRAVEPERTPFGILMPLCDGQRRQPEVPLTREEQLWAQTIIELLQDERTRKTFSAQGKRRAADFSPESITARWHHLLDQLQRPTPRAAA